MEMRAAVCTTQATSCKSRAGPATVPGRGVEPNVMCSTDRHFMETCDITGGHAHTQRSQDCSDQRFQ